MHTDNLADFPHHVVPSKVPWVHLVLALHGGGLHAFQDLRGLGGGVDGDHKECDPVPGIGGPLRQLHPGPGAVLVAGGLTGKSGSGTRDRVDLRAKVRRDRRTYLGNIVIFGASDIRLDGSPLYRTRNLRRPPPPPST